MQDDVVQSEKRSYEGSKLFLKYIGWMYLAAGIITLSTTAIFVLFNLLGYDHADSPISYVLLIPAVLCGAVTGILLPIIGLSAFNSAVLFQVFVATFALVLIGIGIKLPQLSPTARNLVLVFSVPGLIVFPFGMAINVLILVELTSTTSAALFLDDYDPDETTERDRHHTARMISIVLGIILLAATGYTFGL